MAKIEVKNLKKKYGDNLVLDNIDITFDENKIYGLLGRNGAGKTTLLNIMTNRIFQDDGTVEVDGENIRENDNALEKIYFMTEKNLFPEGYKVKDIFKWTAEFYSKFNMEYALELSKKFKLDISKKIKSLSTGYSSIAKIITAMSSQADIIIYDEPVLGLDANHRELFYKELMKDYIENPKTVILSTHIIEEVSGLLENVVILNDKKIVSTDEAEELLNKVYTVSGLSQNVDKYIEAKEIVNIETLSNFKSVTVLGEINSIDRINAERLGLEFSKVELQKLFIYLTNKGEEQGE
ncbi:ABC transporter ATP-binding protein [Clostridium sp. NSJ-6]|uniref:ABC transporter ATP-binding protein n=1 Tax=Clostridium hominis TaxID=2763036 RepID=A0ABR7DAK6_9CLOT|nr:ABC transporter ATP-binding protein [Clostridium hominis]MBC5627728.1 ABC transporter ATP-binding protein [Clostridium hominis]MDU2673014.1 ABC transporter ATP-binding protein [Clostridium sp.]